MRALANRQRYRTMKGFVPTDMLAPNTASLLAWYPVYFSTFPDHEEIQPDSFRAMLQSRAPDWSDEARALTMHMIDQMSRVQADEGTLRGAITAIYDLDFSGKAARILTAYQNGEDIDPVHAIAALAQEVKRGKSNGKASDYDDTDIKDILSRVADLKGFRFTGIPVLHDHIGGILGGRSIAVGARPDKGKTSFISRTLTDWAKQYREFFEADRPFLWLNNEGMSDPIIYRTYQAAHSCTLPELVEKMKAGTLEQETIAKLGLPPMFPRLNDFIRVKNVHGMSLAQIEHVIEDTRPCVVVFDMLANVKMSSSGGNKADEVERAWQEVREMAVMYDFVAISTVQISAEGGNMLYPPYSALKDSKTGIQGATDIIIMMGAMDGAELANMRGFATPKNKLAIAGRPSHAKGEVFFDGARCTFDQGEPPK